MSTRVSVVVPAYNNAAFLRETLLSVLAQTYTDFELVVADHASVDDTPQILAEFAHDPRVRLLSTPAGGGAERNWNRVTQAATGELVKLVCGDDLLRPTALEHQVAAFDAHPDAVMVCSPRDMIDATGKVIVRRRGLGGLSGRVDGRTAVRTAVRQGANLFGEPCCVLLRRSTLAEVGGWHGDPGYMIDQATYSRVLLRGDLVTTPHTEAAFRFSDTQWSVELAGQQSASIAHLHRELQRIAPESVSAADVRRGNLMASLRTAQRRVFYLAFGRRMRSAATPPAGRAPAR
ncbi:glycosyltransferase family 2 protein [Nocardioides mangrovicus]|uniref:Glycosyltransferase family 2 protein n=1 Tax=Nocardioides mangrovicus TaxID=2478913 RepID=A0A3L8P486_9ACTN|nr:glycosyltransferase family A protein [Nocardioides mangrovicus]RLV49931.1 glycosyltransferase family 2 protein [Nocardioides mangrovicus]